MKCVCIGAKEKLNLEKIYLFQLSIRENFLKVKPAMDQVACQVGEFPSPEVFMPKQVGYLSRMFCEIPTLEIRIP